MRESELLSHIYDRSADLSAAFPHIIAGPGHDCAVVATLSGDHVLLKVDQLVEEAHFRGPVIVIGDRIGTPVDLVARKALARAVSDIAAAGGRPWCAMASGTLPSNCSYADALFDAMAKWARHWGCPLVGGDIASWKEGSGKLILTISIIGLPHPTRGPVLRSGAQAGDAIYITGALGGSFDPATSLGRHLTFEPRLAEARWLGDMLGPSLRAMMDISDGLGRDAARLAKASGVRIEIDAAALPRHAGVADWRAAASDGEDYELLFVAAPDATLPASCPASGTPITRIGTVTAGSGCFIRADGQLIDTTEMGWDHR